ncbi:mannosyltransferase family protein [Salinibacterium sp. ZJ454]|uniref:mannosyltransferase family protein n=1 Tax=Salinibacterium sp. ZJ454 TaxID=2708339 RepID=UPI001FBB5814|nr:mannosyltransferase family protein [Salinibacterium sp. ZJ454]
MADRRLGLLRRIPWWLQVGIVFALSRVVTTSILLFYAAQQPRNAWTAASPDYLDFAMLWDSHWYYIVAMSGYPDQLPITDDGHVGESAWAFMPVYPALVRLLMAVTAAPYDVVAVAVSVLSALGAALIFYKLMLRVSHNHSTALFSVVLFCVAPLSPILQVAYAESLQLLLLVLSLHLVLQRRYLWLFPVVAVMSLTRPTGLAFALFLALHWGYRWWRRESEPFPRRELATSGILAIFSGVMGLVWLVAAWIVTGSLTAYTDTELAWRAPYIGYQHLIPFAAWIQGANWWLGFPLGVVMLVIVLIAFTLVMLSPWVRRLGVDLRLWVLSYGLYLLAVFFPQSSTFRLLMPMFPLLGALAQPRSVLYRTGMVLLFIAGQIGWVHIAWWVDGADWTPP